MIKAVREVREAVEDRLVTKQPGVLEMTILFPRRAWCGRRRRSNTCHPLIDCRYSPPFSDQDIAFLCPLHPSMRSCLMKEGALRLSSMPTLWNSRFKAAWLASEGTNAPRTRFDNGKRFPCWCIRKADLDQDAKENRGLSDLLFSNTESLSRAWKRVVFFEYGVE